MQIVSYAIVYSDAMWCVRVLYYNVLYCIVLYCIVLYCIVLYCIVLYCIVLHSTVLNELTKCVDFSKYDIDQEFLCHSTSLENPQQHLGNVVLYNNRWSRLVSKPKTWQDILSWSDIFQIKTIFYWLSTGKFDYIIILNKVLEICIPHVYLC